MSDGSSSESTSTGWAASHVDSPTSTSDDATDPELVVPDLAAGRFQLQAARLREQRQAALKSTAMVTREAPDERTALATTPQRVLDHPSEDSDTDYDDDDVSDSDSEKTKRTVETKKRREEIRIF